MIANALGATTSAVRDDTHSARRLLTLAALNTARDVLGEIASATDTPDWRDVEAADLLDAAHDLLARITP
ncbi:MAG: hypothetical protein JSR65_02575 [Proteobacteria bacterium]|nr:hypothetical protein [Pseudomonadota bacterium]